MPDIDKASPEKHYLGQAVEIAIRLSLLIALLVLCIMILRPFITLLLWGIIIAVAVHPVFESLKRKLRGRGKLAATLITLILLAVILGPCLMLAESLVDGIKYLNETYQQGGQLIPPPDSRVESWPAITKPIVEFWRLASNSLQSVVIQYKDQLADASRWLFSAIAGTSLGIAQFVISIIVAGVFLVYAEAGGDTIEKVFVRIAGKRGKDFARLSEVTIRQVVKGVLGVAIIQTTLASVGFFVAGVPAAGLWAVLCLILAIIQIGISPVVIPLIIYMFSASDTLTASLFMVWSLLVLISENVLKPILLGRGAPVPMLVIFLGSIGGFVSSGFLGLFLGAVILSLAYKLTQEWLSTPES